MRRASRWSRAWTAALVALVLTGAACSDDDAAGGGSTTSASAGTVAADATSAPTASSSGSDATTAAAGSTEPVGSTTAAPGDGTTTAPGASVPRLAVGDVVLGDVVVDASGPTTLAVRPGDDEASLHERIKAVERELLVETVAQLVTSDPARNSR